jgi:branched-chain amino acid transport system ATP-binding protein
LDGGPSMLLEVEDLIVDYGSARALREVSLVVREETIVALIGSNGAGKTTLLRTISGLISPRSGRITFEGERIDHKPAHQIAKRGIAHVPEGRMVLSPMTVGDNLRIGAYLRKDKKQVVEDLDRVFQLFPILKERRTQLAGSLSGGEQQMLAVGRALMIGPKMLLMDEPSMGLSPMMVENVANMIREINKDGIAILLVEQNASMALALAQEAYVLEVGVVTLKGSARALARDPGVIEAYLGGAAAR